MNKNLINMNPAAAFFAGLLVFTAMLFLVAFLVQITYNASVVVMAPNAVVMNYWQAMAFIVLVFLLGALFSNTRIRIPMYTMKR